MTTYSLSGVADSFPTHRRGRSATPDHWFRLLTVGKQAFIHLSGSQTLVRDRPVGVQLAALVGSSPAEMAELKRRLEKCLVSELKEIARRFKLPISKTVHAHFKL